jgi:eukaryotic-like serine/threonine-protein kinase
MRRGGAEDVSGPLTALGKVLDDEQRSGIEGDFADFVEKTGSRDPDLFVQYLYQQGLISYEQLMAALWVRGVPDVSDYDDIMSRFDGVGAGAQRTFAKMSPEGAFALLEVVGEGSMGQVFIAKDHDLRRKVAFKTMSEAYKRDPSLLRRFIAEVQITGQLDHPGIVPVYALEVSRDGRIGYAMKLVHGDTLQDLIDERRRQWRSGKAPTDRKASQARRIEVFMRACDAVAYAHSRDVIHRDLKPDNVMVGRFGEVFVMDWGLARLVGVEEEPIMEVSPGAAMLTRIGEAVGTPAYMSPEQAQGLNRELDARSDLYALGLILQELITLEPAIDGKTATVVMNRAASAERNPVRQAFGAPVDKALIAIIERATAANRDDRYPHVAALGADLRRYLRGDPVDALPEGFLARLRRALQSRVEGLLIAFLLALVVVAGLLLSALAVVQAVLVASDVRQEALTELLTDVAEQGHAVDLELSRYERLLEGVGASTTVVLTEAEADKEGTLYMGSDFDEPASRPPDLAWADHYQMEVSFAHPSFHLAPTADLGVSEGEMRRLLRLRRVAPRSLLTSRLDDGAPQLDEVKLREVLGAQGANILWLYVGLRSGVHFTYPGHGDYPDIFDPRKRPWYVLSKDTRGTNWGNPYIDMNGQGLVLPCSRALHDPEGEFLGVVGVDLAFEYIIERMLKAGRIEGSREAFLLDEDGNVVVRSEEDRKHMRTRTHSNRALRLSRFESPEVVEAVQERQAGYIEVDLEGEEGSQLVVFVPLDILDWTYVIVGSEAELLASDSLLAPLALFL